MLNDFIDDTICSLDYVSELLNMPIKEVEKALAKARIVLKDNKILNNQDEKNKIKELIDNN